MQIIAPKAARVRVYPRCFQNGNSGYGCGSAVSLFFFSVTL